VDRLEILWPSGLAETWQDQTVDRILTLEEGAGRPLAREGEGRR
jgi:hypothetical protein